MKDIKITFKNTEIMKSLKPDFLELLSNLIDQCLACLDCKEIVFVDTDMIWYANHFDSPEILNICKRDWSIGFCEKKGAFLKTTNYFLKEYKM